MIARVLRFTIAVFLAAQGLIADAVDDFIRAEMERQRIPGLSLCIVKNGEIIKAAGYGVSNRKLNTPATPETVYKIASVSKQFIASGVMLLVQEGRIDLNAPIAKYLEGAPAGWKAITVRHLLTHTAGLAREAPGFDSSKAPADSDLIRSAYPVRLRFAPGEKWEYSNTGYYVLAEIIHRISGLPWTEYLHDKIFVPSGMTVTFPTNTKSPVPNRAQGYVDNEKLLEAGEWQALRPSGAFLSTVLDLAKWDAVLYTDKILSSSTRSQMWTPVKLSSGAEYPYGFGWMLSGPGARRFVHHTGGMPGFRSGFARFVDDGLTVIFLMNLDDVDPSPFLHGVAALYLR
jgi:D-alanyl-D-alanine carboxypeptidase